MVRNCPKCKVSSSDDAAIRVAREDSSLVEDASLATRLPQGPAIAGRCCRQEEGLPALPWEEPAALGALAQEAAP